MAPRPDIPPPPHRLAIPYWELVALVALLMSMSAMSIDIMLPSLPEIAQHFALADPNQRQGVVTSYFIGLAAGQLIHGPLSDRFGRKRLLMVGLGIYLVGSIAALAAGAFLGLLAARVVQGFGGAAARVIATAMVRDLFSGRQMARVMSFAQSVFIIVPVFAPAVGQGLAALGGWRSPFMLLAGGGIIASLWSLMRMPETRAAAPAGHASPPLASAVRTVLSSRPTLGYTLAAGFLFGILASYIGSAQQVFVDVLGLGPLFPLAFGSIASAIALAAITNASLVQRLGMRRLSHTALVAFIGIALLMVVATARGTPNVLALIALLWCAFFTFGLMMSNFNAIAMQPLGAVAGTAASLIGFYSTAAGATFGFVVGRAFDGTLRPLAIGYLVLGCCALLSVLAVEGRAGMFRGE